MDKSSPFTHPPDKEFVGSCGNTATNFEIKRLQSYCNEYRLEIAQLKKKLEKYENKS